MAGLILAVGKDGALSLTDLRTDRVRRLTSMGAFPASPPPWVSPDGKYVLEPAMAESFSLARPTVPFKVANQLNYGANDDFSLPSPFADRDADIVVQYTRFQLPDPRRPTSVQDWRTGRALSLGTGDVAAGDPQQPGAFVPVSAPGLPRTNEPDIRIELRDAGRPPVVLATAAKLERILGIKPKGGVLLRALPSPQGSMVAVEVLPYDPGQPAGIVVLDRTGKVLGFESAGGPLIPAVAWSPSGGSLAFIGRGRSGVELTQWQINGLSTTSQFPYSGSLAGCLWSPDSTELLCGTADGTWFITAGGQVPSLVRGPGRALAWLNGDLGR